MENNEIESELYDHINKHNISIITGPTGFGKTTRIPLILSKKYKRILVIIPQTNICISIFDKFDKNELIGIHIKNYHENINTKIIYTTYGTLSVIYNNNY